MNTNIVLPQIVFYAVVVSFALSVFSLIFVVIYFKRVMAKFYVLKSRSASAAEDLIANAQAQAVEITHNARAHAAKIINEAGELTSEEKETLMRALESSSNKYVEEYTKMLSDVKNKAEAILSEELQTMRKDLSAQSFSLQSQMVAKVESGYAQAEKRIEEYRQSMFARVDSSIHKLLLDVSSEVLGKSLTFEDQEEFILKSLDSAKRRNVF